MPSSANIALHAPLRRVALRRADLDASQLADQSEDTRKAAYQHGFDDATQWMNQQLADQRAEVIQMQEQAIRSFTEAQKQYGAQMAAALPRLAGEIVRRLFSGLEPDGERIELIVRESLGELAPGTPNVEIALSAGDLALMQKFDPQLIEKYPDLRFIADPSLASGDCLIRSGYGLIDARLETKLKNLTASFR